MAKAKRAWLAIGLIITLAIIIYANSLHNPFIWDDQNLIVNNPYIKDIRLVRHLFTKDLGYGTQFSNFYRPLQSLSLMLDYYLWGLNPLGFHLTNLLLHLACALVIYFLFSLIFPSRKLAPLITALLFLAHPLQTEAVTYISGRADALVSLFILLSLFFYSKQTRQKYYLFVSVVFFILALLSKETALVLPLLLLLYDLSFAQDSLRFRDKFKLRYGLFLLAALIYILLRSTSLNFIHRPLFFSNISFASRMLTSAKVFALYLGLLIFPLHLHMERSIPFVSSILDKDVLCFLTLLVLLVILIIRNYRTAKFLFFASLWFFFNLLPVANIVPLNANMAEHWLYLACLGFLLLVAGGIERLFQSGKLAKILSIILSVLLVGAYAFLTIKRNQDWKNPQKFFQTILYYSPQSAEAHNCLGIIYEAEGKLDLAINEFKQAVKLDPQNYKSYGNLGSLLRQKKEYDAAISVYQEALKLQPDMPGLYNNLGNIYADKGQWNRAKEMFNQALKLYPEFALCRANLANVYYNLGDTKGAISEYKQAIALNPNLVSAHFNLGTTYVGKGLLDEAIKEYRKVVELDPANSFAYYNLGVVYFKKENLAKAKENFEQALKLNPHYQPSKDFLTKLNALGY